MTKKKHRNNNYLFILVPLIVVFVLIFALAIRTKTNTSSSSTSTTPKESSPYTSAKLNLSFTIPEGFLLEELPDKVLLKAENNSGEIRITREATGYTSLDSYIIESDKAEKLEKQTKRDIIKINGLDAIMSYTHYPSNTKMDNKSFIFYKDNTLTIIHTASEELYSTLDQIALSLQPGQ